MKKIISSIVVVLLCVIFLAPLTSRAEEANIEWQLEEIALPAELAELQETEEERIPNLKVLNESSKGILLERSSQSLAAGGLMPFTKEVYLLAPDDKMAEKVLLFEDENISVLWAEYGEDSLIFLLLDYGQDFIQPKLVLRRLPGEGEVETIFEKSLPEKSSFKQIQLISKFLYDVEMMLPHRADQAAGPMMIGLTDDLVLTWSDWNLKIVRFQNEEEVLVQNLGAVESIPVVFNRGLNDTILITTHDTDVTTQSSRFTLQRLRPVE